MENDYDFCYEFPEHEPLAVFSSVITRDGDLVLPPDCLMDVFQTENFPVPAVLTYSWKKGFLSLYPAETFEQLVEEFQQLNKLNPKVRLLYRMIVIEAVPLEISKESGITVIPEQMERLGFDPDKESGPFPVTLLKHEHKIEIVSSAAYSSAKEQS